MRATLFFFTLILVGCSGNGGDNYAVPGTGPPPVQHAPAISELVLSPSGVPYLEGDGSVTVTASIVFEDTGLDLQTLWVRKPDGTNIEFDEFVDAATGTLTEEFTMSTKTIGSFTVEFWLVDKAGDSSVHRTAFFSVFGEVQSSDWTSRMSGLPYALNDVIWDGAFFIAVGDGGAVLTSSDGIEWSTSDSGTDANLNALAAYGSHIFAVGDEIVLSSTNHGADWATKATFEAVNLHAVVVNSSQVVVGGFSYGLAAAIISLSEDRGETWQAVSWPAGAYFLTDIIYRDGLFVATTDSSISSNGARVKVSTDGRSWNEIIVREDMAGLYAVVHDGSQFIISGSQGSVFTSFDGFNWIERQTPIKEVDYLGATWNGSKLVLAGGISWWYWWGGITPPFERPVGLASADGGENWEIFNIDGHFQSQGITWGNGLFVSVGQSTPISGEGAIYTAE